MKRLTTEEFIKKARLIHGDKYDYSLVNYKNSFTKVKIICPIHGIFNQIPNGHLAGKGCSKCGKLNASKKISKSKEQFIKEAKNKYGDKYDYSLVDYKNERTKVKIICPIHGVFEINPHEFLSSQAVNGCPKCGMEERIKQKSQRKTTKKFIEEAKNIQGNKYDYSLVNYINAFIKIKIICPIHGIFEQKPNAHLSGKGCPKCNESHGEKEIRILLENNNVNYEYQKRFEKLKSYPFDFYLPEKNIVIEFQGEQHYKQNSFFGDLSKQQERDKIKRKFCEQLGIKEIEIKYDQNILTILKENDIIKE